ncbi:hypothetical protein [Sulfolobus acidocaldarius]|uniref:Conserved protein n=1 Tax=Sulfolobus acidocaldarius (strain ATCC 33909 / DSM 639 / JCM 8929 / NBRC 15157 / NCIMB 11770) TaxID=330779 RepID=Q4J9B6_SULAC|nr:hypothetical protein [Sulfolobus acidocaldarius]AAY80614.1 conserved protein [Sulfolobus acidocaldarius DSM 639]
MNTWKIISLALIVIVVIESVFLFTTIQQSRSTSGSNTVITPVEASSPIYRQNPLVGQYPFLIKSGIKFYNLTNLTIVTAFVILNISKIEVSKDWFLLYSPINPSSVVPSSFLNNPLLNISLINATVFYMNGHEYLNITIKVYKPAINELSSGGSTFLLDNGSARSATVLDPLYRTTFLCVVFKPLNQSEVELEFYVTPVKNSGGVLTPLYTPND